jgi:Xaa-Pro aminopeptidase
MPVDLDDRIERLDRFLAESDLEAVWFAAPNGFAWLTGGDSVVARGGGTGVAVAGYDGDRVQCVTNNIEAERLASEEIPDDVAVESSQWYERELGSVLAEHSPTPAGIDVHLDGASDDAGFERIDPAAIRVPLTPGDVAAYRQLSRETAGAVENIARGIEPEDTERDVAAALRVALFNEGIEAPVALVGGSRRAQAHRHYTPKDEPLGDYALLSVTAQRGGLHTSTTRCVAFDPPDWLEERHRAAATVEAAAIDATRRAGAADESGISTVGDVFGAIQDAYATVGFEGEWQHHHQGGAAGFAGREWKATPDSDRSVELPMGFAWNPTVQGAKSEDTVLIEDDAIDVLSETGTWPTITVEAPETGFEIERHAVLTK